MMGLRQIMKIETGMASYLVWKQWKDMSIFEKFSHFARKIWKIKKFIK